MTSTNHSRPILGLTREEKMSLLDAIAERCDRDEQRKAAEQSQSTPQPRNTDQPSPRGRRAKQSQPE